MKNRIEEKLRKLINEVEVSNVVAPELNVDRDRKKWLRKQGKDAEGLPEGKSSKCQLCHRPLNANPYGPDKPDDEHYTHLGNGPYCEKCYEKMQATDDRLANEGREMQVSGVFEADEKVTCPNCSGSGKRDGKTCPKCKGVGKLTRLSWEKQYGNPATMKEEKIFAVKPADFSNVPQVDPAVKFFNEKIEAPVVSVQKSVLGGPQNVAILISISLDPKNTWENGIFHNSRYMMFHISNDGVVVQHNRAHTIPEKFRKVRVQSIGDAVAKINKYISTVKKPVKDAYNPVEDPNNYMKKKKYGFSPEDVPSVRAEL